MLEITATGEIDLMRGAPVVVGTYVPRQWLPAPPSFPDRTRSGLVKRTPRRADPVRGTESAPAPRSGPAIDRHPAEVRTMLSAFRAGTRRGETESADAASSTHEGW